MRSKLDANGPKWEDFRVIEKNWIFERYAAVTASKLSA